MRFAEKSFYSVVALGLGLIPWMCMPSGASAKTVLRIVHWSSVKDWAPALKEFEKKYPNYEVKQETRAWGTDYVSKLLLETATGKSGDVYMIDAQWFSGLIFKNAVLKPLSRFAKADKLDLGGFCVNPAIEHGNGSEFYALAQWLPDNPSMWVNKNITDNAGVQVPEYGTSHYDTWRWDDLLAAAKKTTKFDGSGKPLQWGLSNLNFSTWVMLWAFQNGAEIFDDPTCRKDTRIDLTGGAFLNSVQWLYDAMYKSRVMPAPGKPWGFSGQPFTSGKVAFTTDWNTIGAMMKAKFNWTVMPMPYQTRKVTKYGGNSWAIAGTSKNAEGAWKLVRFLTTDLSAQLLLSKFGPLSSYRPQVQIAQMKEDPKVKLMNQVLISRIQNVTFRPLWMGSVNPTRTQQIMQSYLDKAFTAKQSVDAAMTAAEKEINSTVYKETKR